ncbi:MAG: NADH-quinone oxidoreductase subunit N [Candidatus Eisenbacteria bacterium]|uniref:NADH-quinone oxidoreductase subunit N n=1 Tax=Eiseniibacteriota bacterium TaxID=2212470 RepID=A0A849SJF6_UNCEI|nr:NADH-quinone oxidoreductase subunit N [Candidatus Eisenbacteria bacterium]
MNSVVPQPHFLAVDWWALGPVIALSVGAMLILMLEFLPKSRGNRGPIVALLTLAAAAYSVWKVRDVRRALFEGMYVHDGFTVFFVLLFCAITAISVLLSWDYVKRTRIPQPEYYALMLSSTLGMIIMAASNDLITFFVGLELMSLALYVLVGFRRSRLESSEAALKYFLLGAFASGFLLYGIALLYGATGTTNLTAMSAFLSDTPLLKNPLLIVGSVLLLTGFAFKIAAVPFHMWTPDAYEGAPTTVTGYMSVGAKAAAFAGLLRVVINGLDGLQADWKPILIALAILTMTVGNVTALLQNNVKRMLAYSSIAHAGYILVAVVVGGASGGAAALFYLAVYALMNLGAFGLLGILGRDRDERVLIADLRGLGFRQPLIGIAFAIFMLSLGGIPPTAGFMAKIFIFGVAIDAGYMPLVIVSVLNSVVSIFYYLRVTVALYMQEPQGEATPISWSVPSMAGVLVALGLTIWWGLQGNALLEQARRSMLGLM